MSLLSSFREPSLPPVAVELAARNRWQEAVDTNRQLISLGEDADTYNRLGKA